MKRNVYKALIPVIAAATLVGCTMGGGASSGSQSAKLSPDAKVSGSISVWSWDVAATALKRMATSYEKQHSGTTIKVVDVGYDNAYDKLSVGLQAGSGVADVVTIETDRAPGYIAQFPHGFVNMMPMVGKDKADFDPSKWEASSDSKGNIEIVPWDSGTVALYYRTDYLKEAGIDPASLDTWDATIAAGEKIKAATGHTLISADISSGGLFQMLLQQEGQGLFNKAGDITVSSPEGVKALSLLKKINDKGLLQNVKGWDGRVSSAKKGDSAVTPEAVWWIGTLTGEMPELSGKYGVTELPAFTGDTSRTSNSGGSGLAVTAQSKNPQLAASFVTYVLANKDNQASMMQKEGLFPSYLPALKDDFFQQPDPYFGGQKVYQLFADQTAKIQPIASTNDNAKASDIVATAVVDSVINGKDPAAALKDAAQQIATATGRKIAG